MNATRGSNFAREKYADIIDEIHLLLPQHYAEVKLQPDQITLNLDDGYYRQMEDLGNLVLIAARADGKLVGYATVFLKADIHSAHTLVGFTDSYFLHPQYRRGWTGVKLIRFIEQTLKELGVKKIYIGATQHIGTASLFRFGKYHEEETIFSKIL